jgi:hypothetical protein
MDSCWNCIYSIVLCSVMKEPLRLRSMFVYWLGTKCSQVLEHFSLVQRNNHTNFSICPLNSHWHNIIIIRHIYGYVISNPTGPFCTRVSKIVPNTCSAKMSYINRLTHKNCKTATTATPLHSWLTDGLTLCRHVIWAPIDGDVNCTFLFFQTFYLFHST